MKKIKVYSNIFSMIPFLWKLRNEKTTKAEKWHEQSCMLDPILKMKENNLAF